MSPAELSLAAGLAAATVRVATPLALAALGETIAERSGVINLGVEGAMLAGALAAAIGAAGGGLAVGLAFAVVAGLATAALFATVAVVGRTDQIIAGTAVTLGMIGLTGLVARAAFGTGGAGLTLPVFAPLPIPGLSRLPLIGVALFAQPLPTYLLYLLVPCAWWLLFRTRFGLELRAAGESPRAAAAAGVRVRRIRFVAVLAGGGLAGLAGAALVLAQVGTFTEKMTAGRGFLAIAIVVLGRWHPIGALLGALLFGLATALQFTFQASGSTLPWQLFQALPFLLALTVLVLARRRGGGPAGLGEN